ncbi:hypothetical protein Tco_1498239 [Tanacetum coccineum]
MVFPRLQELAATENFNNLTDAISIQEHKLLIAELNVFGGPLALQCAEFLKQLSQTKVVKMLEVQEDGTKTICIDCWFEAQPGHGMSLDTRPKPDREAM